MSKPLLMYVTVVLFPVMLGTTVAVLFLEQAEAGVRIRSDVRMSRAGSYFLSRELVAARDSLTPRAVASSVPNPPTPAARRALSGDTVLAVAASENELRVTVLLADATGLRAASGRIPGDFVAAFQSVTSYGLSVYLGDNRVLSGTPPLGPRRLPEEIVRRLRQDLEPLAMDAESGPAILTRVAGAGAPQEELSILVGETERPPSRSPVVPTLAVLAMVLLLSLAAAWSVQARAAEVRAPSHPPLMQSVLVALLPVLAGSALLAALGQGYDEYVERAVRSDLARASALLRVSGQGGSVEAARDLGFDAGLIDRGALVASTIEDVATRDRVAAIRPPPPTFSTTGSVPTDEGAFTYLASRAPLGGVLVLLARGPEADVGGFRIRLLTAGLLMGIPALLYLGLLVLSARKPTEASPR